MGDSLTVDILKKPANESDVVVDLVLDELIEAVVGGKDLQRKPDKETDIIDKTENDTEVACLNQLCSVHLQFFQRPHLDILPINSVNITSI